MWLYGAIQQIGSHQSSRFTSYFHDNFLPGRSRWVVYSNKYGYDYDASQVPPEWLVVTKCNYVFMDFTHRNPLLRKGPVIFCL